MHPHAREAVALLTPPTRASIVVAELVAEPTLGAFELGAAVVEHIACALRPRM